MNVIFAISLENLYFPIPSVENMWYHIGVSDLLILLPIISCPLLPLLSSC